VASADWTTAQVQLEGQYDVCGPRDDYCPNEWSPVLAATPPDPSGECFFVVPGSSEKALSYAPETYFRAPVLWEGSRHPGTVPGSTSFAFSGEVRLPADPTYTCLTLAIYRVDGCHGLPEPGCRNYGPFATGEAIATVKLRSQFLERPTARSAAWKRLRARYGSRLRRMSRKRLNCSRVSPTSFRCRVSWLDGGRARRGVVSIWTDENADVQTAFRLAR
jgi:hypothetical protein